MAGSALTVSIDTQQKRVNLKPVASCVNHGEWEKGLLSNCVVEPITGDLILTPRAWESGWYTSNSGNYTKLLKADFSGLTSALWIQYDKFNRGAGKTWLIGSLGTANTESALTTTSYPKNQSFHFSFQTYGGGDDYECARCGWSDTPGYTNGVALRFWASGTVWVYKDGNFVGQGEFNKGGSTAQNIVFGIALIPCRRRELLIVTDAGQGFVHTFEDIAEDDTTASITPAGKFWVRFPSGTPNFQLGVLKFNTSGTAYGLASAFKNVSTGSTTFIVGSYGGTAPTPSFCDPLTLGAQSGKPVRLKLTLTGSGDDTCFVKGCFGFKAATTADTPDSPTNLDEYLLDFTLSVPDDPGGVTASMMLKSPYAIEQAGAVGLRSVSNRPIKIRANDLTILDGLTEGGAWDDAITDETRRFHFEVRDRWKSLERCTIDDPWVLDGLNFRTAIIQLLDYAIKGAYDADIETTTYTLPNVAGDEWSYQIDAGETVANALRKLFETFASTWVYGFKPSTTGIVFFAKSLPTLGTTAKVRLYLNKNESDAASVAEVDARRVWVRKFHEDMLEPEANEIWVTGYDIQAGRPIVRGFRDDTKIDPTLNVADRQAGWQGEVLTVGVQDPTLNTPQALSDAMSLLSDRLTLPRRLTQFESEMLWYTSGITQLPVWRGDVIEIVNVADGGDTLKYRILSFEAEFKSEFGFDDDLESRRARYVAEEIQT